MKDFLTVLWLQIDLLSLCFIRGKEMLNYEDDLSGISGYDLVHHDDLAYVASAHQERE